MNIKVNNRSAFFTLMDFITSNDITYNEKKGDLELNSKHFSLMTLFSKKHKLDVVLTK